jgi:hypothetical protein
MRERDARFIFSSLESRMSALRIFLLELDWMELRATASPESKLMSQALRAPGGISALARVARQLLALHGRR